MRKNFFKKKLATTVALAMVVASLAVPPQFASAATATKIVKQGGKAAPTVLYVGDKGTDYGLSKTYKGNKYTWTISNSAIATINKSGVVTAKTPGTVTIKCTARDSKGKWLKAFTQKLTIRQRVSSVDAASEDFELAVGASKDLNAVKTPASSTDSIRYYSDNTEVATVDAKTGVVKAVGVGEATITVYAKAAWNTPTASKYNRTDSVKVTVLDGIQAVKQTVSNVIEVTFATDQSDKVTESNITITDADGVKQTIDEIDFSADGKTATVTTFLDFEDGVNYKVAYDNTEKSFTASVGEPASVVLKAKTVEYDKETDLDYAAYDKNGVDVSSKIDWENDVDWDYDESDAEIEYNEEDEVWQITVYDYPDSVDVEMTYNYYDEAANDDVEFTSKATIKSVEELTNTASDIQYTLTDDEDYTDVDWDEDLNTTIPADEDGYRLFIKAENQDGDDIYEWNFDEFESTDEDVLTVSYDEDNKDDDTNAVYVYPVEAGTAYIKATYGDTTKTLKVTVGDEPEQKSVSASDKTIELYSAKDLLGEDNYAVKIDLDILDQYGNDMDYDADDIEVEHKSGDSSEIITAYPTDNEEVIFYLNEKVGDKKDDKGAGNNTYEITVDDEKSTRVTVKVNDVDDTLPAQRIELEATDTDIDVAVDDDDAKDAADQVVTYTAFYVNKDGDRFAKAKDAVFTLIKDDDTLGKDIKDNAVVSKEGVKFTANQGVATFTAVDFADKGLVTRAAADTYKIEAESVTADDDVSAKLVVKDTQRAPSIKQDKQNVSEDDVATVEELIEKAFTVKLDGYELDGGDGDLVLVDAEVVIGNKTYDDGDVLGLPVESGDSVRVKSIKVQRPLDDSSYYIEVKADVNDNVKVVE